ncbi:MAG: cytochrome P450 [Steroidobacteraceae bacterium]
MSKESRTIPRGPADQYNTSDDLLRWMGEQFERFGDIFRASIYGANVYAINTPKYAEHVLLNAWRNYPKGQAIKRIGLLLGNGLMVSKGALWKRQRRLIQPAFSRTALDGLSSIIVSSNVRLLARWEAAALANSVVNVTRDISAMILEIVLLTIFGDDFSEVAPVFKVVTEEVSRDMEFAHVFSGLGKTIIDVANKRQREKRVAGDFLGVLMQARDRETGEGMTNAQLAKEIMTLIVAGHETTASALNWTWYLLSHSPLVENRLTNELRSPPNGDAPISSNWQNFAYCRQIIEEALRLYPPGWLMTRRAINDDQLGEYFVPAGTEIYISPYFIQRNPRLWEAPDEFNPERFEELRSTPRDELAMLPFSVGPRNCIGEYLARMEMQLHLIIVASRLRMQHVDNQAPKLIAGVNLLSAQDFIMRPHLRTTPSKDSSGVS